MDIMTEKEKQKQKKDEEKTEEEEALITILDVIKIEHDYLLTRNKQLEESNKLLLATLLLITLINVASLITRFFLPT